jgi:hypothetical protein
MATILGILLFFGITITIFWLFNEFLWRSHDLEEFESDIERRSNDQTSKPGNDQPLYAESPGSTCQNITPPNFTIHGPTDVTENC